MEKLSEQIKIITREESELLKADKFSKSKRIDSGLYLVCEPNSYEALDFSERHNWSDYFGSIKNAPKGWHKKFTNPLDAIDWLINIIKD